MLQQAFSLLRCTLPLGCMEARLEQYIHAFVRWVPDPILSMLILLLSFVLGLLIHKIVFRISTRLAEKRDLFWRSLVQRTRRPVRLAILTWIGWMARTALHIWTTVYLRRFKLDAEDNLLARKHVTQSRILERVAVTVIIAFTISAALMSFPGVRQYGVSLMASAGVAGIVLGLALQPVLKNLFAGIQLAITQPIRIDDALLVEGEWGNVEEITSTYVVVKLWDWRRLILPLGYFIETPFQNWTREGSALIGTVIIYLDYSVPVAEVRRKVEEIAANSSLWDRDVVNVAVTDFKESVMEVRILVSASNAGRAFDQRCEVREKLIDFIQQTYPSGLPKVRAEGSTDARGRAVAAEASQGAAPTL